KLAGWASELDRNRQRMLRALEGLHVGKLSGAVGTYAATDPELERIACERLGLGPAPSSTQILQRDRHAELLTALAIAGSSLDKFALEIRHLARTEVAEVQEPFGRRQKVSPATTRTASCSATRCAPGTRSSTSARSFAPTTRSRRSSTWRAPST